MPGEDPRYNLPDGRILDRDTHDALVVAWAAVNFRTMTSAEIEAVVGAPLDTPSMRVEFGTGLYPPPRKGRIRQ